MQIPKLKRNQAICITWDDAWVCHDAYWSTAKTSEIRPISTVGYYVKRSKRYLTIAQSLGNGRDPDEIDGYGGLFAIPIGTIRSITKGN